MASKDAYYFRHDANASSDLKLKALRKKYKWKGQGWYWFIVEKLRSEANYKLSYSDLTFDGLSEDLGVGAEKVKQYIDDCIEKFKDENSSLFTKNGNYFYSDRLNRDMERLEILRQQNVKAGKASAAKRFGAKEDIVDERLAKLVDIYEKEIGMPTPAQFEELKDILDEYPEGWFEDAAKEASLQNKRNLKYILGILKRWKTEGKGSGKAPKNELTKKKSSGIRMDG